jgi:monofunctional biosynthetic peptidoglycan transglycosylase
MLSVLMLLALELDPAAWFSINDGVMGGVSSSAMNVTPDGLVFEGELSLENNGGFASVRRQVDSDLSTATGLQLKVRADGRTYQVRLRHDGRFDGIAWRAEFSTSAQWQTVTLDFSEFKPVFRGRQIIDAGPVLPSKIRQIGFMVADRMPGPFRLEIGAIEFLQHHQTLPKSP